MARPTNKTLQITKTRLKHTLTNRSILYCVAIDSSLYNNTQWQIKTIQGLEDNLGPYLQ